ncbi:Uncharacterised protein [Serratia marcescens]|uniref:ead/Ea22-like family protein n=1 Tax=Serratia marcescens TaxID=615 RepID=UPI000745350F|nr:ead/Ea22-like family protein [Serratia marcescens]CUZ15551.1 Uncharacterised protein [Serratia marcescens]CVD94608.1 Uncharacterised protein [Serratia marcescens]
MDKFSELKVTVPANVKSHEAVAAGFVTHNNTGGYFVIECQECGAVYPSQQADGGGQIADTGDYGDAICPHCGEEGPDECENVGLAWNVQQAKIIALLAELEAKDKRIGELERANQSQGDHINQQQDRIELLEKKNSDLGKAIGAAEKRLATPVRLPETYSPEPWMGPDPSGTWLEKEDVKDSIRTAGFKVEGDE